VKLVVDASVALKWFFLDRDDEAHAPAALDILQGFVQGRHSLLQPAHFQAEVCAVLAREAPDRMERHLASLHALAFASRNDDLVYLRAMQLSAQLNHHLFDTLYHALALETEDAVLVTADGAYCRKAAALGRLQPLSTWSMN
jgi:predicted nucleic acid-binding protein